jgi:hypothetical protein
MRGMRASRGANPVRGRAGGLGDIRPRRAFSASVRLAVSLVLLGGCSLTQHHPPSTARQPPGRTNSAAAPLNATPPAIRLSGRGPSVSRPFRLLRGLAVFNASHHGSDSFWLYLLNEQGRVKRVLVGRTGRYAGSVGFGVPFGTYRLRVTTVSSWRVVVSEPRLVPAAPLPRTYTGGNQTLVGPFRGRGDVRLTARYDGSHDFVVDLLNEEGDAQYTVVEETGPVRSSARLAALEDGSYYLNVDADGPWVVTLSASRE